MKTYLSVYQGEQRAAQLEIRDQDDVEFTPTKVYAKIVDSDGSIVLAEAECVVINNNAVMLITSEASATVGSYEIIWRVTKTAGEIQYTYYHKTDLMVEEL